MMARYIDPTTPPPPAQGPDKTPGSDAQNQPPVPYVDPNPPPQQGEGEGQHEQRP